MQKGAVTQKKKTTALAQPTTKVKTKKKVQKQTTGTKQMKLPSTTNRAKSKTTTTSKIEELNTSTEPVKKKSSTLSTTKVGTMKRRKPNTQPKTRKKKKVHADTGRSIAILLIGVVIFFLGLKSC